MRRQDRRVRGEPAGLLRPFVEDRDLIELRAGRLAVEDADALGGRPGQEVEHDRAGRAAEEVEAEAGPARLAIDLVLLVQALVEVAEERLAIEAAEPVAHRHREALAVAAELDHRAVARLERQAAARQDAVDHRLAIGAGRRVVERVHHHLVAAALDAIAVHAAQPDRGGERGDALERVGLAGVVTDGERVHAGAPGEHLGEAEDVAEQEPRGHRGQLGGAHPAGRHHGCHALVRAHRRHHGGQVAARRQHDDVRTLGQAIGQLGQKGELELGVGVVRFSLDGPVEDEQLGGERSRLGVGGRAELADLGAGRGHRRAQGLTKSRVGRDGDDPASTHRAAMLAAALRMPGRSIAPLTRARNARHVVTTRSRAPTT